MNELEQTIESYNKERFFLIEKRRDMIHYNDHPEVYKAAKERIEQIDAIIERLLTLKYYPVNKS